VEKSHTGVHFRLGFRVLGHTTKIKDHMLNQAYRPCHVTNSTNLVQLMAK